MTPNEFMEWAFVIFCAFLMIVPVVVGAAIALGCAVATVVEWWKEARR